MTKFSLEADAADTAAPIGVDAAVSEGADDETLIAGAIAAKLLALKKNSTFWASKFNKTKFAAEDVDAVEKVWRAESGLIKKIIKFLPGPLLLPPAHTSPPLPASPPVFFLS